MDPAERSTHAPWSVEKEDLEAEEEQIREGPDRLGIIPGAFPVAFLTDRPGSFSGKDLDNHRFFSSTLLEKALPNTKGLKRVIRFTTVFTSIALPPNAWIVLQK